jgi:peptidase M28-like protein/PA domain-containing protein
MQFRRAAQILAGVLVAVCVSTASDIDPKQYLAHIKYLASPELKGRGTGTPELEKAAGYIARQFHSFGLKPAGDKSYYQPFSVTMNAHLGARNHFEYRDGAQTVVLKPDEDFRPFNFSSSGKVSGAVVFVGYGITAPEYKYDDYAGVDVKNKLVLVLRHEPQEFDDRSVFAGRIYTTHSQFLTKAVNAEAHGARGVIFMADRNNHRGEADELEKFSGEVAPGGVGIPFVGLKAEIAERWLREAGKRLDDIGEAIDKNLRPQSFALPGSLAVELTTDVERETRAVHNVAGLLEGETREYLIIGAHYDHVGLGYQFSMAPSMAGTIHPGADDNASGTAGVIELARWFAGHPKPRRGVLFLTFAGEEVGLLGSSYYVDHPELPLNNAVAMVNLDMIGRLRDGKVYVGDVGSGSEFKPLLESTNSKYLFSLDFSDTDGYGSSDHFSFTPRDIPVLFFFTGLHPDYHRPSDTWDKITAKETARLLDLVGDVCMKLASEPERPHFVRGLGSGAARAPAAK